MERILCAIILLFYTTDGSEMFHAATAETKGGDFESETEEPRAKLRLYGDNIAKLKALRVDVSQFVATYDRPVTEPPSTFKYFRKVVKKSSTVNQQFTILRTRRTNYVLPRSYPSMLERRTLYYNHFLNAFSFYNDTMKRTLLSMRSKIKRRKRPSQCLNDTFLTFQTRCNYRYYTFGGNRQMRGLLNQICSTGWMTVEQIVHIITSCCQKRFKFNLFNMNINNIRLVKSKNKNIRLVKSKNT